MEWHWCLRLFLTWIICDFIFEILSLRASCPFGVSDSRIIPVFPLNFWHLLSWRINQIFLVKINLIHLFSSFIFHKIISMIRQHFVTCSGFSRRFLLMSVWLMFPLGPHFSVRWHYFYLTWSYRLLFMNTFQQTNNVKFLSYTFINHWSSTDPSIHRLHPHPYNFQSSIV